MDNSEKIIQLEAQINALKIKITELCIENTALRTENTELKQENAQLKHSLNQNSQNSSKPPSSDGLKKLTRNQSLRKKVERKAVVTKGIKVILSSKLVNLTILFLMIYPVVPGASVI